MSYNPYTLLASTLETEDTYRLRLRPAAGTEMLSFKPGQYVFLKNPAFASPDEEHPFSIASSPVQKEYLEFCIKTYGDWTQEVVEKELESELLVSEPQGTFVWDEQLSSVVFLLGGIGISPIMSMLRTVAQSKQQTRITLIYGNRTPDTIAYEKELEQLEKQLSHFNIVHVFSDIPADYPWEGHRGFITKEILHTEVDFSHEPTFYFVGPPIFIEKMRDLLVSLDVPADRRKEESLAKK